MPQDQNAPPMSHGDSTSPTATQPARERQIVDLVAAFTSLTHQAAMESGVVAARVGIGGTDLRVLLLLSHGQGLSPKDVAASVALTTGAITALIDRLEKPGFVERRAHPSDRRSLVLELTRAGVELVEGVEEGYAAVFDEAFRGADIAAAVRVVEALSTALAASTSLGS
jgi:DNA-binding MarR family transcriptional regulator